MMPELLGEHAATDLVCFGRLGPRSAGQLLAFAARIGEQLPARTESDRVLIACRDRYCFIASLLAVLERGLSPCLPANGQPETVLALGRSEGVVALLHDQAGQAGIDVSALERPGEQGGGGRFRLGATAGGREPSLVLFTSGSTGRPQAHHKGLGQLLREAQAHVDEFGLRGRRCAATVPPHHIYGLLFSVCAPLLGGGSALRETPLFPRELCADMVQFDADVMISVPPQLFALAQDATLALPRLHRAFSSAGPLAADVHAALNARGMPVTEILGSTETGGIAFREQPEAPWRPLRHVRVTMDAENVLWVDSPWLSDSAPRPLRTADRAEWVGEGFRYLGRADAVTKIGGRRVDLGDVEACLREQPGVRDARVLAVDSGGARGLSLWAVIEADAGLALPAVRSALAQRFDPVTLPKRLRVVSALPRVDSGKVPRSALLALFDVWEFTFLPQPDGSMRVPVPRNSGFLRGHFEGDPILPGVVQLKHIALREARRRFPELGAVERVTRVKFKRIVQPGEELVLTLERKGSHQVQFAMRVGAEPSCSGIFHFREAL